MSLDQLIAAIWTRLEAAPAAGDSPLRTPVLGTIGPTGECALRTVILRAVDGPARRVVCHTDRRSPKVRHIAERPRVVWLFYDAPAAIQIRLGGDASVHTDDETAARQWHQTRPASRRNYLSADPPGTPAARPTDGLPSPDPGADLDAAARRNFAAVACTVEWVDWLRLDPGGNTRARFTWSGAAWRGTWIVP